MKIRTLEELDQEHFTENELEELRAEAMEELLRLNLQELRREFGLTQTELADRLEMTQAQISQIESRTDFLLSTIRRYVEALGGELEINAVFGDIRVKVEGV